jgi:repressor LexA
MFSNQDSQGHSLVSAPGRFPACKDTISSNGGSWQDIVLFFLRLNFAFGTPTQISFKLGTDKTIGEDFFATFRYFFATMAGMSVTRRQKEVIDFISGFVEENGYSPSFDEIARGLNLKSLATVHKHVTNLQKKGLLERAHNRSRSIDILPPKSKSRQPDRLPLMGRIAAGLPVDAAEASESISLGDIIGNKDVFALEVRGDSMRDEHIVHGDYVLVERVKTARPGEIIVALVRGSETTLKRYYIEGDQVRLQPSNVEMAPIYVPAEQLAIQGRVLGILRKYA